MAKGMNMQKIVRNAVRVTVNVIVAGIIFMVATSILNTVETTAGVVVSSIVTLLVLLVVIPQVFAMRKGPELITELILAIPAGLTLIALVQEIFNVTFEVPALAADAGLFSLSMAVAVGSYFTADLLQAMVRGN